MKLNKTQWIKSTISSLNILYRNLSLLNDKTAESLIDKFVDFESVIELGKIKIGSKKHNAKIRFTWENLVEEWFSYNEEVWKQAIEQLKQHLKNK